MIFRRILSSVVGGVAAGVGVALVDAQIAIHAHGVGASGPRVVLADVGVIAPIAAVVSLFVGLLSLFLWTGVEQKPPERSGRDGHSWIVAMIPAAILALPMICVSIAHLAMDSFTYEEARGGGLRGLFRENMQIALLSLLIIAAYSAVALALVPTIRALTLRFRIPRWLPSVVALGVTMALMASGVLAGDTGGGGGGPFGIFGVLKRQELDLRPVGGAFFIALGAYFAATRRVFISANWRLVSASILAAAPLLLTLYESKALSTDSAVTRVLEHDAPLGKVALSTLRRVTDRDHDGASALFGGGDCNDKSARQNPSAVDIPGNGVDEDCSGADLPVFAPQAASSSQAAFHTRPSTAGSAPNDLNLIFITIDTLRTDVGFMGYMKPVTPNLDKLAAKGVIFDRAYAMASYTGKSVGPLLIGKYPSETDRDGGHFNTYAKSNVFITERLKAAGFHTMGAASHWYFAERSGLTQGMDIWDLSARPSSGQGDNDTSMTSAQLSDAVLRLLGKPENTSSRFFMWIHYVDPHAQYMPHEGAPNFAEGTRGGAKAAYDGEVWFTDKHVGRVLDFVASQPWGGKTAVVVTADHGEAFGEHNMSWHGVEIWEPLMRVPLVVYFPGVSPHHVPVMRSQIDLVPTLLDMMRVQSPSAGELSGESMMNDIVDLSHFDERDVYIDMPIGPYTGMRRAVIWGQTPGMKLIHFGGPQYQLFDLAKDPGEKEDLSHDKVKLAEGISELNAVRARLHEIDVKPTVR